MTTPLDEVSAESFEALLGTRVSLSAGEMQFMPEVKEVHRLRNPSPRKLPPFVVLLRDTGATRSFSQGIYRLHHPTLGALDLFVVAIGPDSAGMCYEVTFN